MVWQVALGGWAMDMLMHDDLCPAAHKGLINPNICTYCQIILQVRAQERARQFRDPFTNEYDYHVEGRPE